MAASDVYVAFVREDQRFAEALAVALQGSGFTVSRSTSVVEAINTCDAIVVLWTQASSRSQLFIDAADRAYRSGKMVLARMSQEPLPRNFVGIEAHGLFNWNGDPEAHDVDAVMFAVHRLVNRGASAETETRFAQQGGGQSAGAGARGVVTPFPAASRAAPFNDQPLAAPARRASDRTDPLEPRNPAPALSPPEPPRTQMSYSLRSTAAPSAGPPAIGVSTPPPFPTSPIQPGRLGAGPPPSVAPPAPPQPPPPVRPAPLAAPPQAHAAPPPSQFAPPMQPPQSQAPPPVQPPPIQPPPAAATADPLAEETAYWRRIRYSQHVADYYGYLERYGRAGEFAELAESRIRSLTMPAPTHSPYFVPPGPSAAPPAVQQAPVQQHLPPPPMQHAPPPPVEPPPPRVAADHAFRPAGEAARPAPPRSEDERRAREGDLGFGRPPLALDPHPARHYPEPEPEPTPRRGGWRGVFLFMAFAGLLGWGAWTYFSSGGVIFQKDATEGWPSALSTPSEIAPPPESDGAGEVLPPDAPETGLAPANPGGAVSGSTAQGGPTEAPPPPAAATGPAPSASTAAPQQGPAGLRGSAPIDPTPVRRPTAGAAEELLRDMRGPQAPPAAAPADAQASNAQ